MTSGSSELSTGWYLARADEIVEGGKELSGTRPLTTGVPIPHMPATILRVLSDTGLVGDVYSGDALARVDRDLWRTDWWYATRFTAPAGHQRYVLALDGISYRADVWLNGERIASADDTVGPYRRFAFDVSGLIRPGTDNGLAIRIVPERRTPGLVLSDIPVDGNPSGVDLADTWADWLNFRYHGDGDRKQTYLPDRNSGVFKRVRLEHGGPVSLAFPSVRTRLPLPRTDSAELTVYVDAVNYADHDVDGSLIGRITRPGKPEIHFEVTAPLKAGEARELRVGPDDRADLRLDDPDLWWPYTWGDPALYRLDLEYRIGDGESATTGVDFGIRTVTGKRDATDAQPQFSDPGSFYIQINGRDYLVRGAAYSPDLLFVSDDPNRVRTIMAHAKDLGVNLLRWEGHVIDDGMLELADREGMPTMFGTMCCGAWERWSEWDAEDRRVAQASVESTVKALRAHPSIVIWSNGSDGLPPEDVLSGYHRALETAHWQNAVVDTVSTRNRDWSGVHMNGPYSWRAPAFWFMPDNPAAQGSCAEEGNNETVPLLASLRRFVTDDHVWPIDDVWAMHAGSANDQLAGTRKVVNRRFGGADSVEEFVAKAQIAQYEQTRAQMEAYGALGWETHKFTVYWMLNTPWPSFFGHVLDAYWGKGGAYFGLKQGLRPLSAVFDSYASGGPTGARVFLVNQGLEPRTGLSITMRRYHPDGTLIDSNTWLNLSAPPTSSTPIDAPSRPAVADLHFVRLTLADADDKVLVDNTYWHAAQDDVPDLRSVEGVLDAMRVRQRVWPDYSTLFSLPTAILVTDLHELGKTPSGRRFEATLRNPTSHIAFFVRVELRSPATGTEILPSQYDHNFVTVYPHETATITATVDTFGETPEIALDGINLSA